MAPSSVSLVSEDHTFCQDFGLLFSKHKTPLDVESAHAGPHRYIARVDPLLRQSWTIDNWKGVREEMLRDSNKPGAKEGPMQYMWLSDGRKFWSKFIGGRDNIHSKNDFRGTFVARKVVQFNGCTALFFGCPRAMLS